jgi:hypothetical protein
MLRFIEERQIQCIKVNLSSDIVRLGRSNFENQRQSSKTYPLYNVV